MHGWNRDTVEDAEATGGVIDGGTWEHRKRAKEMLKTAETALNVTLKAKGAHHMGQYLPKEVSFNSTLFCNQQGQLCGGEPSTDDPVLLLYCQ